MQLIKKKYLKTKGIQKIPGELEDSPSKRFCKKSWNKHFFFCKWKEISYVCCTLLWIWFRCLHANIFGLLPCLLCCLADQSMEERGHNIASKCQSPVWGRKLWRNYLVTQDPENKKWSRLSCQIPNNHEKVRFLFNYHLSRYGKSKS